jgi:hypothetical protein
MYLGVDREGQVGDPSFPLVYITARIHFRRGFNTGATVEPSI